MNSDKKCEITDCPKYIASGLYVNNCQMLSDVDQCHRNTTQLQDYISKKVVEPLPPPAKDDKAKYYDVGGIITLDVIKAKLTYRQYEGWLLGNLIKYSCRANYKEVFDRDIEKVAFYSKELNELNKKK